MKRFISKFMDETILYGGLPMRRRDVHTLCTEHLAGQIEPTKLGPGFFAFDPQAVDIEPMSLDDVRSVMLP